jgi:hypothetical protein
VTPLDAAALVALLAMPFHWMVKRELQRLEDSAYLRAQGVVIVCLRAIDSHAEPIGRYRGQDIWRTLTFKDVEYRFDRVISAQDRERVGPGELYLEPGLVYVAV